MFQHILPEARLLMQFGGEVTSWYRDPVQNQRVGGSPFSQHLAGFAFDVVHDRPVEFAAIADSLGFIPIIEKDHVHVQFFPAGVLRRFV